MNMKDLKEYIIETVNKKFEDLPKDIQKSCMQLTQICKDSIFKDISLKESDFEENEVYFVNDNFVNTKDAIDKFWRNKDRDDIKYLKSINIDTQLQLRLECEGLDEQPFVLIGFDDNKDISCISMSEEIKYLLLNDEAFNSIY